MGRHLILHRAGAPPERIPLTCAIVVGGTGEALGVGASPAALRFTPSRAGALVETQVPQARAAGRPLLPGTRRLLRPGERVECLGAVVELVADAPAEGTRALAGVLLREAACGETPVTGAHLVVLDGPQAGRRIPLGPSQTIGRGRSVSIRVPDSRASRTHARLAVEAAQVRVEDLGSKNGLRVNGAPLESGVCCLRPGDEVTVGSTTLALVASEAGSAGLSPAPGAPSPGPPATETQGHRVGVGWPSRVTPMRLALASAAALLAATALGLAAARS